MLSLVQCFEPLQTCIEIVTPTETSKRVSFRLCAHFSSPINGLFVGPYGSLLNLVMNFLQISTIQVGSGGPKY